MRQRNREHSRKKGSRKRIRIGGGGEAKNGSNQKNST